MKNISIKEHNWPSEAFKTYDVFFFDGIIFTTVTYYPATVAEWIFDVKSSHRHSPDSLMVGLAVTWPPSSTADHRSPIATVQLCVGSRCLIYQIFQARSISQTLANFLSDQNHIFVGARIKSDLEKLENDYGICGNVRYVDLARLAADLYYREGLKTAGPITLASIVLGKWIDYPRETVAMSRWDNMRLTAEQVQYACVDAFVSFEIGRRLNACYYTHRRFLVP